MNIFFFGSYLENNNNTLFNSQACGKKKLSFSHLQHPKKTVDF